MCYVYPDMIIESNLKLLSLLSISLDIVTPYDFKGDFLWKHEVIVSFVWLKDVIEG